MTKLIILCFFLIGCGKPINEKKAPALEMDALRVNVSEEILLNLPMFKNFDLLPMRGDILDKNRFWSGDSWRLINGSINYRWNSPGKEGRYAIPPHPRDLKVMKLEQLKQLSPSEKYDLLMGRYDYPLKNEIDRTLPDQPQDWEGLCHGWAAASLNHFEPSPKVLRNPDGLMIPFGSSDIKALLTYYYSKQLVRMNDQYGQRCERNGLLEDDQCDDDVSPVAFHAILANTLGLRGMTFIMDIERYKEVWNHPIVSYESKIRSDKRNNGRRSIIVQTTLNYTDVVERASWEPTNGTYSHMTSQYVVSYKLELDREGNMLSGMWLTNNRPDFIWRMSRVNKFEGYLAGIEKLIE